jgi:hypothetical protein
VSGSRRKTLSANTVNTERRQGIKKKGMKSKTTARKGVGGGRVGVMCR